jgi:hypothetical protein
MMMRLLILLASGVLGLAAGFLSSASLQEPRKAAPIQAVRTAPGRAPLAADAAPVDQDARRKEITAQLQAVGFSPSRIQRVAELTELFASFSREELLLAAESLLQIPAARRDDIATILALRLLEIDPEEALRVVREEPGFDGDAEGRFLHEWLQRAPEAALEASLQLAHKRERGPFQFASTWRIKNWAARDPAAAAKLAVAHAGAFGEDAVNAAFASWAEKSPQDAMAEAAKLDNVRLQRSAMREVMSQWAAKDPDRAAAWLGQLEDDRLRAELTVGLAVGTASVDPARSAELLQALPAGRIRSAGLVRLAESSRGRDMSHSLRLAAEVPFDSNDEALKSYYSGVLHDHPARAIASLLDRFHATTEPEERQAIEAFLRDPPILAWPGKAAEIAQAVVGAPTSEASAPRLALVLNATAKWAGATWLGHEPGRRRCRPEQHAIAPLKDWSRPGLRPRSRRRRRGSMRSPPHRAATQPLQAW